MGEQTIRYMNERGSVTIDSEIREVLDLKEKKALLRLCEIEVVKVDDDEIDVEDLPDETCRTISRINNRGIVRIDEEVRTVLGINGRKAMLKIGDIKVAQIVDEPTAAVRSSTIPIDIGTFYARTVAVWSQTRAVYLRAHQDIEYPISRSTAMKIIGTGILIAMASAVLLGQNGALQELAAGNLIEWISMSIALSFGVIMIVLSLPDRKEAVRSLIENPPQ